MRDLSRLLSFLRGGGWRGGAASLLGALAVLGFSPFQWPLFFVLALGGLLVLLYGATPRQGAWYGFWFGLSHFTLGFSWVLLSLNTYGEIPLIISIAMLLGLAAAMAVYPALFGALVAWLVRCPAHLPWVAPAAWVVTEWLRAHLLTGFAWNLAGYIWSGWDSVLQVADLGGVYLLSWLALILAAWLAMAWEVRRFRSLGVALLLAGGLLGGAVGYGHWRSEQLVDWADQGQPETIRVALVQGNITQDRKWNPSYRDETMAIYLQLSRSLSEPVDLVVWPETAIPFFIQMYPNYLTDLADLSRELQAPILSGVPTADRLEKRRWRYHNSMVLFDVESDMPHRYDKHHLVPFGEYIPLRRYVPDFIPDVFKKFSEGTEDFWPGDGAIPLPWKHGAIGGAICYEAVLSDQVRELVEAGAHWLVNITNDAWFGDAAKPQHLDMARLRAVENRTPLIRVANTGISAVFDQWGHTLGRIEADQRGSKVVTVPAGMGMSLYQAFGESWILGLLFLLGGMAWINFRGKGAKALGPGATPQ